MELLGKENRMSAVTTAEPPMVEPLTLSVEEAGQLLGISRGLAYESARRGEIPTLRLGRALRVPRAKLMAMLETPDRDAEAV
jgi:excisionase family DNA binding protein